MELLKEISNKDIGLENKKVHYSIRNAARAVLFDNNNDIALVFVSNCNYHKLPGGGIESGEDIKKALEREIMEEAGCAAEVKDELGLIIEYRDDFKEKQFSYCFIAEVLKNCQKQFFTKEEIEAGFQLKWVSLDKAIELVENDQPNDYVGKFITKRDTLFLKKAKEIVG